MTDRRLEVANLSKTFGPAKVLREVHLAIEPGEIHGLVGQNGCGKSTLVKLLTGVYWPDPGGSVRVDGQQLSLPIRLAEQRAAGVSVVHQNLGLVDDRTVWENVRVGRFNATPIFRNINKREERRLAAEVLARLGRELDVDTLVGDLSAEARATVAIARAVQDHSPGGGLIIFDESTRALGLEARARFFEVVESIVADGASVLLISHQLEEVVEVTDRVTVLRDGAVVESGVPTASTDEAGLTRMMLGRHVLTHRTDNTRAQGSAAVTVSGLCVDNVSGFSLVAHKGEIVGLTGLVGSGFAEVAEVIGGARRATNGTLTLDGTMLSLAQRRGSSADFIKAGIAFVPEERLAHGLAGELSVAANITLPRLTSRGNPLLTGSSWQNEETVDMIKRLDIRPSDPNALVATLSGGNQQKVLLGKWLAGGPQVLVLHEPTQAVDVGARHDIMEAIRSAAADGCGVIVASIDAGDLAVICDRVLVFQNGAVVTELTGELDSDQIIDATFEKGNVLK